MLKDTETILTLQSHVMMTLDYCLEGPSDVDTVWQSYNSGQGEQFIAKDSGVLIEHLLVVYWVSGAFVNSGLHAVFAWDANT